MPKPVTLCSQCKHFRPDVKDRLACDAYPDGIPSEILTMEVDHRKPYKGDHGIQFEPIEGEDS